MFLFGALHKNDIITIDQNNDISSYTLKISNSSGQNIGDGETIDITIDLNALNVIPHTLSVSADFMDNDDTLFSSVLHNMSLTASSSGLNIIYTVNGSYYGNVSIGNGNYLGLPYGLSKSCPLGSTSTAGGYACDITNLTLRNFLSSFFPIEMGNALIFGLAYKGVDLTQTVAQYFSKNTNIFTNMPNLGHIPKLVDLINQNANGFTASHAYITFSGIQYGLTGNGIYEGALNFTVPLYADVWGNYSGIGIQATCPGAINLPFSPNPYTTGGSPMPVTANDIINNGINMFMQNNVHFPSFSYNCSLSFTGTLGKAGYYLATHLFDISIPLNSSATTLGQGLVNNIFDPSAVSQALTNDVVSASPLSASLSTPQVINSMVLSANGLDVYMESK
jgi:hypothetical protein